LAGTVVVKYILVNALSLYSLLLGRTFLSKLGHVVSFMCLKVKFPTLDDKSETMKVDQKIARKHLHTCRGTYSILTLLTKIEDHIL